MKGRAGACPHAARRVEGGVSTPAVTHPILPPAAPRTATPPPRRTPGPDEVIVHSCTGYGGTLVIAVRDEIDHYTVTPLRAMLAAAADHGYTRLVLDTAGVTFCDSGLLRILDWWHRPGRGLRVAHPSPAVRRLLYAARGLRGEAGHRAGRPVSDRWARCRPTRSPRPPA